MSAEQSRTWAEDIERIYNEQGRELWALFYAHCSDADRAYDALQEAFTRLQEQNGDPIRDLRAWLLQVGRNWLRDVARRQRVAAHPSESLDQQGSDADEPSADVSRRERRDEIRNALSQLKTADREVLVLRYSLNWPSNRIANVLETTAAAVDMRLSRARKRLAEILENAGIEP